MKRSLILFFLGCLSANADQGALIAQARDALVEKSIQKLKSYCQGTNLVRQEDYVYLCHLQVKADCENKKPKACAVLKETEELERQALVTDKSVEAVKPAAIFSTKEKEANVLTYTIRHGFIRPDEAKDSELRVQLEALEAAKNKLNPFQVQLDCDSDAQCKLQNFGVKGCGGPMGTMVYSTKGTDPGKILAVQEFNQLDKKIQDEWREKLGIGDSCEYLGLSGKLTCENSVCVLR